MYHIKCITFFPAKKDKKRMNVKRNDVPLVDRMNY